MSINMALSKELKRENEKNIIHTLLDIKKF